ncbi:MAG: electron transfer flavoprotein subunit beta/FixA family protein [Collinsella sp.]|jgi:electron transfer flavoprotein beta subunit|uniref:electron transfer flavoprotein subunit beta/FixA family protein n=1 Tax=Collinsella sp. TaxID=1965294 RepID=UPI0039909C4F
MNIVVCVKAVPGSTEVKMDTKTHTIIRDGGEAVVNPFDAAALEVALRIKDEHRAAGEACTVTVLSMGIPATEKLLRDCIARGADAGLLLSDRAFAGADTLATTYALSCGIARLGAPDLVLCGKMAVDGDTAQIGPELAGALNVPCAVGVTGLPAVADGTVTVQRESDAGVATAAFPLPAVLTVAKDVAELRMASIAGIRAAEEVEITVLTAEEAGADTARTGLAGSPTQVVRSFVPERDERGVEITADAAEQAMQIAEVLKGMAL